MKINHSSRVYPQSNILNKASSQAKISQTTEKLFWTPVNTLFCSSFLVIFLASTTAISSSIFSSFNPSLSLSTSVDKSEGNYYPTSLPWIKDESDCLNRGRTWNHGKCWDKEHDPMF
jgi:hypothetical protein